MSGKTARRIRQLQKTAVNLCKITDTLTNRVICLQEQVDRLDGKRRRRGFLGWLLHVIGFGGDSDV